jgi:hypothetical protein
MIRWSLVVLVACGTPATHPAQVAPAAQQPGPAVPAPPNPDPGPSPEVVHPASRAAIEAPHAGAIVALAVTPDGASAITSDQLGGARLWTVLDGSREPLVVDLPRPKDLAIGTRADGFTVVVRDEVGGLYFAHVDRDGRTRAHSTLPAEPAYVGMAMTPAGLVAWKQDQTIELVGPDGRVLSRVAAEGGQRLLDVSAAGSHVVALVESLDKGVALRRVRSLDVAPKLAWGSWLAAHGDVGQSIAISPSGARFATVRRTTEKATTTITVFDAAKGDVIVEHPMGAADAADLGFIDDEHLALAGPGALVWMTGKDGKATITPAAGPLTSGGGSHVLIATGPGKAFSSANGDLAIVTPNQASYLGYGVESPTIAQPSAEGRLMVGVADAFVELDKGLLVGKAPTIPVAAGSQVADMRWLGGDDWLLVESGSDGQTRIELVDVAKGTSKIVREKMAIVPVLMYEPSTHLITLSLGDTPEVDRYDPDHHVVEKVAVLAKPKGFEQAELVPVAPARAGGAQIVRVAVRDRPTIQWLDDPKKLTKATATVTVDNASFAGADSSGHVFVWRNTAQNTLELAVYASGKPAGVLPSDGPVALWPDPAGARVVEVGQRSVSLYKLDGTREWVQELAGTTEALWLGDGSIAIVSAAGIARLDAATGKVLAARCGWKFGITNKPHPVTPQIEPVCVQLAQ